MYEIIWQYDKHAPHVKSKPSNPVEAQKLLLAGNRAFADFFAPATTEDQTIRQVFQVSPQDVGLSDEPGRAPTQEPFAAFLSCADARVPVELIFSQRANDLFVVRVAGNVLGDECLGSLDFAIDQLGSVRLLVVLGHTGCGAVSAAVDAYLNPGTYLGVAKNFPLHSIVNKVMGPVRGAALALSSVYGSEATTQPGFRQALIETSVIFNAALTTDVLQHTFNSQIGDQLRVVFGIYNLEQRNVGLPAPDHDNSLWQTGLFLPPAGQEGFTRFGIQAVGSRFIRDILFG
jgi:carbonic anhydrase